MTGNDLDKLTAIIKQERDGLLLRWRQERGNSLQRGSLTFRRSTITFPDCSTNWLSPCNSGLTRQSRNCSANAALQLMVYSVCKTTLKSKRSLLSITSFAAASTILPTTTG